MPYIRAKQYIPNIHYLWCDEGGRILEDQSQVPQGDIVDNVPDNEIMQSVREYRNDLLRFSDWTQLSDVPLSPEKILEWRQYRQALRDFPNQIDVANWTGPYWPAEPDS